MLAGEGGGKFALVVIVAKGIVIVDSTNINDNRASRKDLGVTSPDQRGVGVFRKETEEIYLVRWISDTSRSRRKARSLQPELRLRGSDHCVFR